MRLHLFLCSLFIDDVRFILCGLLANPLPVSLFARISNAVNPVLKLLSSRGDCVCFCQLPAGIAT